MTQTRSIPTNARQQCSQYRQSYHGMQVVWPQTIGGSVVSTVNFDIQKSATANFASPTTLSSPTITAFSPTEYTTTDPTVGSAVFYRVVAYTSRSPSVISATSSAFQPVGHAGDVLLSLLHACSYDMACIFTCTSAHADAVARFTKL